MSATTAVDYSGALHPMSTETTPTPTNVQTQKKLPKADCLVTPIESDQLNEALEVNVENGGQSGRPLMTVHTPSGVKTAIVLGDAESITTGPDGFVPEAKGFSEMTNVWSEPTRISMPNTAGNDGEEVIPAFSDRVKYLMNMYFMYFTHVVVRLVAKPPLFQSQRYWVAYVPDANKGSYDSAGFDWNPSEQNEIYVVLPWKSFFHMQSVSTALSEVVGKISIIPTTPLVTEEGLASALVVTTMCCPLGLRLFSPKSVTVSRVDAREEMLTAEDNYVVNVKETSDIVPNSSFDYTFRRYGDDSWICYLTWCLGLQRYYGTGIGNTKKAAKHQAAKAGWFEYLHKDPLGCIRKSLTPLCTSLEDIARSRAYCCDQQCFKLPLCAVDGIACRICMRYNYCYCACESEKSRMSSVMQAIEAKRENTVIQRRKTRTAIKAKEEIFEYEYTTPNAQAAKDVGASGDVSERQNSHWQRLSTQIVKAEDSALTFSVDFKGLINASTLEAQRHLLVSGLPDLKLTATTNPTVTCDWRITCGTKTISGDTMQWPGHEWDIKTGEKVFKPYWLFSTSALNTDDLSFKITLKKIAGSQGSTTYPITLWMNTADMTYHHMKDREAEKYIVAEEQALTCDDEPESLSSDVNQTTSSTASENQAETVGPVKSELDWKLATTFKVDPEKVGIVDIPVTSSLFGKYNWFNARRYYKWKGTPRIKVMTTSASTTNAQVAILHADKASADGDDPAVLPLMFPCAKASVNEAAVEMDLKWRKAQPTLPVIFADGDELGYLKLCFIQGTQGLIANASNDVQVSIFTDVSNIEYSHPVNTVSAAWKKPVVSLRLRETAKVKTISGPKIAVARWTKDIVNPSIPLSRIIAFCFRKNIEKAEFSLNDAYILDVYPDKIFERFDTNNHEEINKCNVETVIYYQDQETIVEDTLPWTSSRQNTFDADGVRIPFETKVAKTEIKMLNDDWHYVPYGSIGVSNDLPTPPEEHLGFALQIIDNVKEGVKLSDLDGVLAILGNPAWSLRNEAGNSVITANSLSTRIFGTPDSDTFAFDHNVTLVKLDKTKRGGFYGDWNIPFLFDTNPTDTLITYPSMLAGTLEDGRSIFVTSTLSTASDISQIIKAVNDNPHQNL
ncbi:hypothetical protein 2 [Beihai picorna-like virus 116]|uniref:hypothetical protein 2 n=1 Tax=Beihai picorna-like virus 116 TaxID=1922545 RepID=UPI00090C2233|nr:hypothetical protein 2 [Beihai picorna-like virus 116]APG78599.1 hypothetical protein 2 [Beihai picorna-like virus 116]